MSGATVDTIAVRGIRAWGHHGANPGEDEIAQPIDIDVVLDVDLRAAGASDELAETIDYAALHSTIVELVATQRCRLLEHLGDTILAAVMTDARISRGCIVLAKPALLAGATPSVTLVRAR